MPTLDINTAVQLVETFLYSISTLLHLPVLAAIAVLVLYLLMYLGGFTREWFERRRGVRSLLVFAEAEMAAAIAATDMPSVLDARLERIVQRADAIGMRRLDAVRFVVRVGPALGLMGTLIPMGIALAGLAQGDLPNMAASMTTAFTATVVGLACSVVAYGIALVREHWLRSDSTEIAYAAETLLARHSESQKLTAVVEG
ncbi:MotA/TolQ/ExbB proton channel family protein [Herminiimonas arsenitoxidans]|uniref:MotA/TolQ/ExbB proton channel family protein n=1 Tax=Herminiimonas arsenitoxidans TaxID=1809410 RepID=UPI0009704017|nr:MotA/TolQ/ExbB proton channel family protein [Herminiimonas arsenitoxidans]